MPGHSHGGSHGGGGSLWLDPASAVLVGVIDGADFGWEDGGQREILKRRCSELETLVSQSSEPQRRRYREQLKECRRQLKEIEDHHRDYGHPGGYTTPPFIPPSNVGPDTSGITNTFFGQYQAAQNQPYGAPLIMNPAAFQAPPAFPQQAFTSQPWMNIAGECDVAGELGMGMDDFRGGNFGAAGVELATKRGIRGMG